jgi:hypothetical protein
MSKEQYQPTSEDYKKAKKSMTDEQKKMSDERDATLEVGEEKIQELRREDFFSEDNRRAIINIKIKDIRKYLDDLEKVVNYNGFIGESGREIDGEGKIPGF